MSAYRWVWLSLYVVDAVLSFNKKFSKKFISITFEGKEIQERVQKWRLIADVH